MRMVYVLKIIYYLHKYRDVQMICVIHDRKESKICSQRMLHFSFIDYKKGLSYDVLEQILFSLMVS